MASTNAHVTQRAAEFAYLHGGFEPAAAVSSRRCAEVAAAPAAAAPATPAAAFRALDFADGCAVSAEQLESMSTCRAGADPCLRSHSMGHGSAGDQDQDKGVFRWRCLEMMLWAEANAAVRAFGRRCLEPFQRYVSWHGEDGYGLQGAAHCSANNT
jgi:hypothetical protein